MRPRDSCLGITCCSELVIDGVNGDTTQVELQKAEDASRLNTFPMRRCCDHPVQAHYIVSGCN